MWREERSEVSPRREVATHEVVDKETPQRRKRTIVLHNNAVKMVCGETRLGQRICRVIVGRDAGNPRTRGLRSRRAPETCQEQSRCELVREALHEIKLRSCVILIEQRVRAREIFTPDEGGEHGPKQFKEG